MKTYKNWRAAEKLITLLAILAFAVVGRADIFEWVYIDSANPSVGKQQSTTLVPDGAGAVAGPGANLSSRDLTMAYLASVDLSPYVVYDGFFGYVVGYTRSDLTSANLSQADLSHAQLNAATLTGVNLSAAEVRWANFDRFDQYGYSYAYGYGTGLTLPQLMSTASYAAQDLNGVSLGLSNLAGANFSGFNLAEARFAGADLTNVNFSNANLTDAVISGTLTGTNLSGAIVRGADLWGISKAQLYSTDSYQTGDLAGIYFYSDQTGWDFAGKNLSQATIKSAMNNANFSGANLSGAALSYVPLNNANFGQANLTDAILDFANLTGASLTDAVVRGANFNAAPHYPGSGLTLAQLYSTSSYQSHDLSGMRLRYNVLTGANFADQNLTNVDLTATPVDGANFTGAEVRGARLERDPWRNLGGITAAQLQATASYQARDLSGIALGGNDLAGINLAGQNLANANFEGESGYGTNLSGADLSQANLLGATFGYTTLAGATLVAANLAGADLHLSTLTGADFTRANLAGGNFSGYVIVVPGGEEGGGGYYHFPGTDLSGANLSSANLTNAYFAGTEDYIFSFAHPGANFTNADLTGADARGANFRYATLTGANTTNLIQSDGHIAGLDLKGGNALFIRNYEVFIGAVVPIVIDQELTMDPTGTLRLEFDANAWNSSISFASGIPVTLGGTLELAFSADVNLTTQLGRTIDLFDWTGVSPAGQFRVASLYEWDLSQLYSTGQVTLIGGTVLPDYNGNGLVEQGDLDLVLLNWGTELSDPAGVGWIKSLPHGMVDQSELDRVLLNWGRSAFATGLASGAVPEPGSLALVSLVVLATWIARRTSQVQASL